MPGAHCFLLLAGNILSEPEKQTDEASNAVEIILMSSKFLSCLVNVLATFTFSSNDALYLSY